MRDVERLKEKIEISLDDRQVWALGLSALLLLGGVFTIGVLVGRKSAPQAVAQGDLTALDAAAVVPIRPQAPGSRAQPAAVEEKPAAVEKPVAVEKPAAPEPQEDDPPAPPEQAQAAGSDEKPAQGRAPSHAAAEPRPAAVVPAPRPPTVIPAPQRPVQVASAVPVSLTAAPRDVGEFTVQIGSSQDRAEALHMENKARAAGLKPYAVEADLGRKGTWYRVRVGVFHDKDSATRYRRDVERELRSPAVVMSTH